MRNGPEEDFSRGPRGESEWVAAVSSGLLDVFPSKERGQSENDQHQRADDAGQN
jgi:hypothetical protein